MLINFINKLLSRINNLDPLAFKLLEPYHNNIILLQITDLKLNFYIQVEKIGFSLLTTKTTFELKPNATIQGKLLSLAKTNGSVNTNISLQGDFSLIEAMYTAVKHFDPDLWSKISPYLGDEITYILEHGVKKSLNFGKDLLHNRSLDITEYLQEEANILPTKFEVEEFCQGVDIASQHVERLEAKITRLIQEKNITNII